MGIKRSELLGNGKQLGLLEKFINGNGSNALKEISIQDMNGVACQKCSKTYPRVPLIGSCECGGGLLFSSPNGLAESVRIGV